MKPCRRVPLWWLHIGTPYRGKRFWTHQIPTSCLPTLLIFIHIEHICYKTSFTCPLFIEVPVPKSGERVVMYMYVRGIHFTSVSMIISIRFLELF
jgi:hypothetical protein